MVPEDLIFAGRRNSSNVYDSESLVGGSTNSLLTTRPAFSNLSPQLSEAQVTPLFGNGMRGQSVANKTAITAIAADTIAFFGLPTPSTCFLAESCMGPHPEYH